MNHSPIVHCAVQFLNYIDGNAPTGLCYGKLEAGILTFVIPGLLLGHLVNQKGTPPQTVGSCSCLAPFRQGTPPQNVALILHYLWSHVQSGLMDNSTKSGLLGVWMVLFTIFAARKFQQPIKVKSLPMICI